LQNIEKNYHFRAIFPLSCTNYPVKIFPKVMNASLGHELRCPSASNE